MTENIFLKQYLEQQEIVRKWLAGLTQQEQMTHKFASPENQSKINLLVQDGRTGDALATLREIMNR